MQHDIYSLGVVLLEIGLWESFISYSSLSTPSPSSSLSPSDDTKPESSSSLIDEENPIPPPFIANQKGEKDSRKRAAAIKTQLISLAVEKLPARMGKKYTDVVLLCLTCLDGTSRGSVDEIKGSVFEDVDVLDEDGIVVGIKYIERILLKIQEIGV